MLELLNTDSSVTAMNNPSYPKYIPKLGPMGEVEVEYVSVRALKSGRWTPKQVRKTTFLALSRDEAESIAAFMKAPGYRITALSFAGTREDWTQFQLDRYFALPAGKDSR